MNDPAVSPPSPSPAGRRAPAGRLAFALSLVVLLATCDERFFGLLQDGQQMLVTAGSIALHGELGISRDSLTAIPRSGGDAVSRYGLATSFVETVPVLLSRALHAAAPGASSAPLFVLVQALLLAAAAGGVAAALSRLGIHAGLSLAGGAAAVLATPLLAYAGSDFSEPLGAAAFSGLALAAVVLRSSPPRPERWEALGGAAAGTALLTKSVLLLPALPLLAVAALRAAPPEPPAGKKKPRPGRTSPARLRLLAVFGAFAGVWALLELVRFGTLLGGYPGEKFDAPFLAGVLRLTVLPNKGLLVYAPLALLAPLGVLALRQRDRLLALSLGLSPLLLLGVSAAWWAWDGQAGWGPRLLLASLPPIAVLSVLGTGRLGRAGFPVFALLAAAGAAVNLPGALSPFAALDAVVASAPEAPIPEGRASGASAGVSLGPDGTLLAEPRLHASLTPSWWPPRLALDYLAARRAGGDVAQRLGATAFTGVSPPLVPALAPAAPPDDGTYAWPFWQGNSGFERSELVPALVLPFRWPFWGRSWLDPSFAGVDPFRLAVRDQALRALDTRRPERALRLAGLLLEATSHPPDARDLALRAEALRLLRRDAEALAEASRDPAACHPMLLWPRVLTGAGIDCVPAASREPVRASVQAAARAGVTLPRWLRGLKGVEERPKAGR